MGGLKTIELYNFKSYKGLQSIELGRSQFTSIIGPNGAGKSNVMDAICFVLGIRARYLRSTNLKDLIYRDRVTAGEEEEEEREDSDASAYVVAVYKKDNGELLHLKRTVASNGSSQFRINDRVVSLNTYSKTLSEENILIAAKNFLVFQGDVEAVASQSPRDLCRLIERLSGSLELKEEYDRLKEAEEATAETSSTIFHKKRGFGTAMKQYQQQKEEADKFSKFQQERDELVVRLTLWKLYHLEESARSRVEVTAKLVVELSDLGVSYDDARTAMAEIRREMIEAAKNLDAIDRNMRSKARKLNDDSQAVLPIREKIKLTGTQIESNQRRLEEMKNEYKQQSALVKRLLSDKGLVQEELVKLEHSIKKDAVKYGLDRFTDAGIEEYESYKEIFDQRTSEQQAELHNIVRRRRTIEDTIKSITQKLQYYEHQQQKVSENLKKLITQRETLSREINLNNEALADARTSLSEVGEQAQSRNRKREDLNSRLAECAKSLLDYNADRQQSERDRRLRESVATLRRLFPGVRGILYDLCRPKERRYETAVATVLGQHFNSVVVDSFKTANECIEYLREQKSGVASFLPLDTLIAKPVNGLYRDISDGVRLAIDVMDFSADIEQAVRFACSNTLICDTMELARFVRWERNIATKVVTVDGSVINKANLMSGGKPSGGNARKWEESQVQKMLELKDQLTSELQELSTSGHALNMREQSLNNEISSLNSKLEYARDHLNETEVKIKSREAELADCARNVARFSGELDKANADLSSTSQAYSELENSIEKVRKSVFQEYCDKYGIDSIQEYEMAQGSYLAELNSKRGRFVSQIARLESQSKFESERLEQTRRRIDKLASYVEKSIEYERELESQQNELSKGMELANRELEEMKRDTEIAEKKVEALQTKLSEHRDEYNSIQEALEEKRKQMAAQSEEIQRLNSERLALLRNCQMYTIDIPLLNGSISNIKLEGDRDGDVEMGEDESFANAVKYYGAEVNYDELSSELRSSDDAAVGEEIQKSIDSINEELSSMVINLRAEERIEDLNGRLKDVEKEFMNVRKRTKSAKEQFSAVRTKRIEMFNKAFEHISKAIDPIYKELTKTKAAPLGGTAYLSLENEDEPYLDGVAFHAMPPQKRFCDMELLSGGERSIAALALLFAIHSYKPSPFFILDEVDAALDNINLSNIANYIQDHKNGSQFVVISLKTRFYENSDTLVGIYRDQDLNSSKALTTDLRITV